MYSVCVDDFHGGSRRQGINCYGTGLGIMGRACARYSILSSGAWVIQPYQAPITSKAMGVAGMMWKGFLKTYRGTSEGKTSEARDTEAPRQHKYGRSKSAAGLA